MQFQQTICRLNPVWTFYPFKVWFQSTRYFISVDPAVSYALWQPPIRLLVSGLLSVLHMFLVLGAVGQFLCCFAAFTFSSVSSQRLFLPLRHELDHTEHDQWIFRQIKSRKGFRRRKHFGFRTTIFGNNHLKYINKSKIIRTFAITPF
jgi:hypothetical protein